MYAPLYGIISYDTIIYTLFITKRLARELQIATMAVIAVILLIQHDLKDSINDSPRDRPTGSITIHIASRRESLIVVPTKEQTVDSL